MSEGDTAVATETPAVPVEVLPEVAPAASAVETPAAAEPPPIPTPTPVSQTPTTPAPEMPPVETPTPEIPQPSPAPQPVPPSNPTATISSYLSRALEKIQFRKRAKLEKIVALAAKKRSIKNDDVEKLLKVSDATATNYLSQLVREGKLKRSGIRGGAVYEPV